MCVFFLPFIVFTVNSPVKVNNYVTGSWSWNSWSFIPPSGSTAWIGLYSASADVSVDYYLWWQYATAGTTSGTFTTATPASDVGAWMPTVSGSKYVMYYFQDDVSYVNVTSSAIFTAA